MIVLSIYDIENDLVTFREAMTSRDSAFWQETLMMKWIRNG